MVELPAAARKDAAELAERILTAAGSGLRHYQTASRERILYEAAQIIDTLKPKEKTPEPIELKTPDQLTTQRIIQIAVIAGFQLNSGYGQDAKKRMPVSDTNTLNNFARLLVSEVLK